MCEQLNITRRSIQCYEKAGLLHPTDRNKYGHLLYEENLMERVKRIRFLNEVGFRLKDIETFIDRPNKIIIEKLAQRAREMREETGKIKEQILNIQILIRKLEEEG
ncbi:MAG: MerR family transcriptional regulator [Lachnospiraceae bacterium]|nr:MerR family transcriptional regulator [Lachnospiraceae bacterium]